MECDADIAVGIAGALWHDRRPFDPPYICDEPKEADHCLTVYNFRVGS